METDTQLCRDCRYLYHSNSPIPCLSCDSTRLTIPCSPILVGVVTRLLDRGIEVVSARCDIHYLYDYIMGNVYAGKTVQIRIELDFLYPSDDMFAHLPPDWLTYEYHTIEDCNHIGPKYTGLGHSEDFIQLDDIDAECEFATALTISNSETWLDDKDVAGYKATWILAGVLW